jgi:hypothetical protein
MKVFPKGTGRLFGKFSTYIHVQAEPTKKDITKATEKGFSEGWVK